MKNIDKDVTILAAAFGLLFFAYASSEAHLTATFRLQGHTDFALISLVLIYGFFTITNLVAPTIISYIGLKKSMFFAGLVYSAFIFSITFGNRLVMYGFAALLGMSAALLWTSQGAYLLKAASKKHYGENAGFFTSARFIGTIAGLLIFSYLLNFLAVTNVYLIYSIVCLAGAFILLKLGQKKVEIKRKPIKDIGLVCKYKKIWPLVLLYFSSYLVLGVGITILPLKVSESFGIEMIGKISFLLYLVPMLTAYIFGKLSDRFNRQMFFYLGILLNIFAILILLNTTTMLWFIIAALSMAAYMSMPQFIGLALIGDMFDRKEHESVIAFLWIFSALAILAVPLTALFLPLDTILGVVLIFSILAFIAFQSFVKRHIKRA